MTKKKLWIIVAVLCLVACLGLSACRNQEGTKNPTETVGATQGAAIPAEYTVEIVTEGGLPLDNISIYIYADESLEDLLWFAKTDSEGKISFTTSNGSNAVAVLENVPEGYLTEAQYPLTGEATRIALAAEMMAGADLTGVKLEQGDLMYDMTVTTPDGTVYQLSELLKEKAAVVLNFWYLECQPCRNEFPYLQAAYEKYSDQIEVLALNPVNDDADAIAAFQEEFGLTFPVAQCDIAWQDVLSLTAYPTTVVIDRFGTISLIHKGSITDAGQFESIFAYYADENYGQAESTEPEETQAETSETTPESETSPASETEPESGTEPVTETEPVDESEDYVMTVGTYDNPDEFSGVTSRKITIPAGEKYYCNVYKVSQLYLRISDPDVYVIYNGKTYYPSNGTVGLTISSKDVSTAVKLVIGNSGTQLKNVTMYFSVPQGTISNPFSLTLGDFTLTIPAGNDQGVNFKYVCKKSGTIMAKCLSATAGVDYDLSLYNLNTYAMRNLQSDASVDADGDRIVTIKVSAGDSLMFAASALPDDSGSYPSVKLELLVDYVSEDDLVDEEDQKDEEEQKDNEDQKDNNAQELIVYAVTITNKSRDPIPDVQVYLVADEEVTKLTTDSDGVAHAKMPAGTYSAVLQLPAGYESRVTKFTLTERIPCISVKLDEVEAEPRETRELINLGTAYCVEVGSNQLDLAYSEAADIYNYFVFEPTQTGLYQVTTTDAAAQVSYWATTSFPYNASSEIDNNSFELNIKELHEGLGYIIGVTGAEECTLVITRLGDPMLDATDADWSYDWQEDLTEPPTEPFTLNADGSKLTYIDLESNAKVVYNKSDGYYHLNSKKGPVVYVNLGPDARYISLYDMLGFNGNGGGAQNLSKYFYNKKGNFVRKEKYTDWMRQYVEMRDETYDVYPLNDALMYMIQNGGEQIGWWNEDSASYKFSDIDLNEDIGWMFACCYIPN